MTSPLLCAAHSASLAGAQAALASASPEDIDRALVVATLARNDALFDLLLPLAPDRDGAIEYCLSNAASDGYLHALRVLLPRAQDPPRLARLAINMKKDEAALAIIGSNPGSFKNDASCLASALLNSSAAVVCALVPSIGGFALQKNLLAIALVRPEVIGELSIETSEVAPTIALLLASSHRSKPGGELPTSSLRGADALLALLPTDSRLRVIEEYPELHPYPVAAATLQHLELEREVIQGPRAPALRI